MRGLPKKYCKMGFKKGWREYKKTLKTKTKSNPSKKKTKKGGRTVAKNTGFSFGLGAGFGKALIGGVAVGIIDRVIPIPIAGADLLIAGAIMKEPLLTKIGAITLGRNLAGGVTGIFGGGNAGNGGFAGY